MYMDMEYTHTHGHTHTRTHTYTYTRGNRGHPLPLCLLVQPQCHGALRPCPGYLHPLRCVHICAAGSPGYLGDIHRRSTNWAAMDMDMGFTHTHIHTHTQVIRATTLKGGYCSHDGSHQTCVFAQTPSAGRPPLDSCRPSSLIWYSPPFTHTHTHTHMHIHTGQPKAPPAALPFGAAAMPWCPEALPRLSTPAAVCAYLCSWLTGISW